MQQVYQREHTMLLLLMRLVATQALVLLLLQQMRLLPRLLKMMQPAQIQEYATEVLN